MERKKTGWVALGVVMGIFIISWANAATVSAEPPAQISTPRPTLTPIIEPAGSPGQPARLHGSIFDWGKGFMPAGVHVALRGDGWEIWSETDESGQYHFFSIGNEVALLNVIVPENRPELRTLTQDVPVRVNVNGELIVNMALYPEGPVPAPIVKVTMTASTAQARPGDEVSFAITVENAWDSGVNQVIVADMLPAGLTYVEATTEQGEVTWDRGLLWVTLNPLAAGGSALVTVKARVAEDASEGTHIVNRVSVHYSENVTVQAQAALDVAAPVIQVAVDQNGKPVELLPVTGVATVLPIAGLALVGVLFGVRRLRQKHQ
ncbi:MAG: DUF11 domain-containing protein [Anaerolineae bacterium]|nr:DUF11 domain-containing protein [Anaerolineae bacterium]